MTWNKSKNGLWVSKEKPKPKKRLKEWDCPHCGTHYDTRLQENEEFLLGDLALGRNQNYIPHIICPNCKKCMGCDD